MTLDDTDTDLDDFRSFIEANGYLSPRLLPGRRYVCIYPLAFTQANIIGSIDDRICFDDRWCYHSLEAAKAALDAWDGVGEPDNWHRHPGSGRRRDNGDPASEYVHF